MARNQENEITEVINTGAGTELPVTIENGDPGAPGTLRSRVDAAADGKNRQYVDNFVSGAGPGVLVPSWTNKLRWDDMNASTGGVARGTTLVKDVWHTVYKYTGSGLLWSWLVSTQTTDNFYYRLVVDSDEIFGSAGVAGDDINGAALYNIATLQHTNALGFDRQNNTLMWQSSANIPIKYSTEVEILVYTEADKDFKAGLVVLSKET